MNVRYNTISPDRSTISRWQRNQFHFCKIIQHSGHGQRTPPGDWPCPLCCTIAELMRLGIMWRKLEALFDHSMDRHHAFVARPANHGASHSSLTLPSFTVILLICSAMGLSCLCCPRGLSLASQMTHDASCEAVIAAVMGKTTSHAAAIANRPLLTRMDASSLIQGGDHARRRIDTCPLGGWNTANCRPVLNRCKAAVVAYWAAKDAERQRLATTAEDGRRCHRLY